MRTILISLLFTLLLGSQNASASETKKSNAFEFKTEMRRLWIDQLIWTRNVMYSIINDAPGLQEAMNRLLQSQGEIGEMMAPFYGDEVKKKVEDLLHENMTIATGVMMSLKTTDTLSYNDVYNRWIGNADQIAQHFVSINPAWSLKDLQYAWYATLEYTAGQAIARMQENFEKEVMMFEEAHNEIIHISDMISNGIIQQFPMKFTGAIIPMKMALEDDTVILGQNEPNPFTEQTTITFFIPESVEDAVLVFYNSAGDVMDSMNIPSRGEGSVIISASSLRKGPYSYGIMVDGKVVDTKKMVRE
jgi:hypothetical protein